MSNYTDRVLLILGNQLFDPAHLPAGTDVLMVEDEQLCRRMPFHRQKLAFSLTAMRDHRDLLRAEGFRVHYHELNTRQGLADTLARAASGGAKELLHFHSDDPATPRRLPVMAADSGLTTNALPTPMFLTDVDELDSYFATKPTRMAPFYRWQRKRLDLLMDQGRPLGGRWSFDADNRKPVRADQRLPPVPQAARTANAQDVISMVDREFATHPGCASGLWIPTDRAGALRWLDGFLTERLEGFGTYEDAITTRSPTVHHGVLSPLLNSGLLTPQEVIDRASERDAPLNDLEGFLRQIVGWREFIRGIYRRHGACMRGRNVWDANRRLAPSWFEASTGIEPLDHALGNAINLGWNHHIERLMVIANLMNLCEIAPPDVYRFFMTHYVDAYDWVMVPNVFGMGLTSEGGVFATKPYICGSNYLRKMGDHARGDWCTIVDGLFWRFVFRHRDRLAKNPRISMIVSTARRMSPKRGKMLLAAADAFLEEHTQ